MIKKSIAISKNAVKNSTIFLVLIEEITILQDHISASSDVIAMFPNILLGKVKDAIKKGWDNQNSI